MISSSLMGSFAHPQVQQSHSGAHSSQGGAGSKMSRSAKKNMNTEK
jgi:hypothetical protein